ncbi:DMT family transporter [Neptuniibacter caesariensis]|uniref:Membrane protein, putative n=1 Tax=Neptuniibacter caesariensis TaxID=207954 RepID=A0A7U8GQX9_NEPCE|nr:DMT family transporter [Neptuniibacter caesariensis]EAR59623.1 membrane protein, putative [Oceanospirillum sp. MED92] [Neptuniibacter caesariensis]
MTTISATHTPIANSSIVLAILSAVFMGTIGVISKFTGLSAEVVTFYRLFFGGLIMLCYLQFTTGVRILFSRPPWQVLLNGCFLSGFIVCYVQAMNYTSMANAIMMVYLAPVAASIFAHFFLGERLNRISFGLIAVALFGFVMMMEFQLNLVEGGNDIIGLGYGAAALFAYAGFIVINRIMPASYPVFSRTWYQLMVGALCMLPFLFLAPMEIDLQQWSWLLLAGLVPGFLAILFAVMALDKLPSTLFGTLAYFEPVAVVIFGWVLFAETLSPLQMSGCAVILASGITQALLSTKAR